jgi:hypothetical protein
VRDRAKLRTRHGRTPVPRDPHHLAHPLIAIETLEEEHVEQALERVAQRLRIPRFVWTMTKGLGRSGALEALYDTREPLKALRNLADLPSEGIYLMKDL